MRRTTPSQQTTPKPDPSPRVYSSPCPTCDGSGLVPGTRKAMVDGEWTFIHDPKLRATCSQCGGCKYLDHPKLTGEIIPMAEAKAKAPKAEKAPKEPKEKVSKFPGTYTSADASRVVSESLAAGEALGSSRSWTVQVDGHTVAPKWLVSKMTGKPTSEFVTGDAVSFLKSLNMESTKAEGVSAAKDDASSDEVTPPVE